MHRALVRYIVLLLIAATTASAAELSAGDLDRRRKALDDLLKEQWEYTMRTNPEFASLIGDRRFNDKSADVSEAATRKDAAETRKFLQKFKAIDARGFSEQEQVNKALMVRNLEDSLEDY